MAVSRVAAAILALAGLLMSACSVEEAVERLLSAETLAFADRAQSALIARNAETLRELMGEEVSSQVTDEQLESALALAPQSLQSARTLYAHVNRMVSTEGGSTTATLRREIVGDDGDIAVITMVITTVEGRRSLYRLYILPITEEVLAAERFDLIGKSALHYAVLAWAVAAPLLSLAALVAVVRTKRLKRRILWFVVCLVGVGSLSLNWSTGAWAATGLSVVLFGAMVQKAPYAPWVLQVAAPWGALLFWAAAATGRLPRRAA